MKLTYALTLLVLLPIEGYSVPKFKNCTPLQEDELSKLNEEAIFESRDLLTDIFYHREKHKDEYTFEVSNRLRQSINTLACAINKLKIINYTCAGENTDNIARTFPILGTNVKIFKGYWKEGDRKKMGVLLHEATHKCATNDSLYFFKENEKPEDSKLFGWNTMADTYSYWLRYGFCVPSLDC